MSIHIQRFVDRLRGFESRGAKDFIMPLQEAKDLHADITRLLVTLETLRQAESSTEEVIKVEISGGGFR